MTADEKKKAFDEAVKDVLKDKTRLQADTYAEIVRLLKLAQELIVTTLAGQPTDYQRWSLPDLQFEINKVLQELGASSSGVGSTAIGAAWQAGQDLIDKPLEAAQQARILSVLPRLDTQQLFAMRAFMTDRIQNIGIQAANQINTELALVVIGTQSPGDAVTAVRKILGDDSRTRAQTIVRTSLNQAFSKASFERMQQSVAAGANIKKKWIKSGKLHPRFGHNLAHGQTVPVHEYFNVPSSTGGTATKMMHPHDPKAPAKEVINCGCTAVPTASGFEDAEYVSKVQKKDGGQWTNAELRQQAKDFAEKNGLSPGKGVPAKSTMVQFAREALSDKRINNLLEIGGVEKWYAIKQAAGHDVGGYKTVMNHSALRHIDKKHGVDNEKDKNQRPVTAEDIARIPEIIKGYDNVTPTVTERGLQALEFKKVIEGEEYTYIAEIRGTKKHLAATTMYIKKKPRGGAMPE